MELKDQQVPRVRKGPLVLQGLLDSQAREDLRV